MPYQKEMFPTPIAECKPGEETSEEPDNFLPLSSGYTSSARLDEGVGTDNSFGLGKS